jgi:anti-sigma-K factor RskA
LELIDIISSGLLELYVLGMANEQETAQVTAWAKQYPEVAAEISAIEEGLQKYALSQAVNAPAQVKEKLMRSINNTPLQQTTEVTGKYATLTSFWKYAAAASILLLIGSALLNIVYYSKYRDSKKEYAAAVTAKNSAEERLTALQESNKEMKDDMGVVQSKYSEPVSLRGLPDAPEAAAKIFWMKNTTGDVYIDPSNLPEPPSGMQYQLWGIVDGKPVSGGLLVFSKKGDKYRIQKMKTFGKADAFAVTLETEGGHNQPEGKMYVMGKM